MKKVRIDAVDALDPELGWVRRCAKCKTPKKYNGYHKHHRDPKGIQRVCKDCAKNRKPGHHPKPTSEQYKVKYERSRESVNKYVQSHYRTVRGRFLTLISSARTRSTKKGIAHDLTIEWALKAWEAQGGRCLITGIPLEIDIPIRTQGEKHLNPYSPSLDRIDPDRGYTQDNTRIVCVAVNLAMNRFGPGVLQRMLDGYASVRK